MKHFQTRTLSASLLGIAVLIFFLTACRKETSYENPVSNLAAGSLWDANGDCFSGTLSGTWYDGVTPNPDTNYVDMTVNVTKVGNYAIYSDTQNGLYLADSGTFTSLGQNTVRLKPVGTFINYGSTTFTVTYDTTSCSFAIPVQDSTGTGLGGGSGSGGSGGGGTVGLNEWQFTAGGHVNSGTLLGGVISSIPGTGITAVVITGFTNASDTTISISLQLSGSVPVVGQSYKTTSAATIFQYITNLTVQPPTYVYQATTSISGVAITYKVTAYDATNKIVTATFDGTAKNSSNQAVQITNGSFQAQLQ